MSQQPAKNRSGQERLASQAQPGIPADAQHAPAVREHPGHFGNAMNAFLVMDRHFDYIEMQFAGAEQKFVVAPKILDTPASDIRLQSQPVLAPNDLCAAQGIFDALVQKERKDHTEEFIADNVGEL